MITTESPIEELFLKRFSEHMSRSGWTNWLHSFTIKPQVWFERYRVDFCVEFVLQQDDTRRVHQVIIECDGFDFHSTKSQQDQDSIRDRWFLHEKRICVIRLPGWFIHRKSKRMCVAVEDAIGRLIRFTTEGVVLDEHHLQWSRWAVDEVIEECDE